MEKLRICGRLGFNADNDRYGLLVGDLWEEDGFHCGQEVFVWDEEAEKWIDTRFEMAWTQDGGKWYLAGTPYRGGAIEGVRASILRSCSQTGLDESLLERVYVEG